MLNLQILKIVFDCCCFNVVTLSNSSNIWDVILLGLRESKSKVPGLTYHYKFWYESELDHINVVELKPLKSLFEQIALTNFSDI